ncbi:hypothetical protein C2857_004883 [Epichloe festucae Fl1]|uniref:Uncharacterized protein n=1 Tax=Epichloe festucae (strain Fl1) TaxID=877507 RepID=A0A7S9KV36_EPIFF|nr:hypothetical protein C2857_004883 [Epichloe festucae Fl1]
MEEAEVNAHDEDREDREDRDDPDDETNWDKPVFKVPVEILPDQLWVLVDGASTPLAGLTMNVKASAELGEAMRESHGHHDPDGLSELWWGMAPSPRALKRRRVLRGL